ncbi:hypothetical protein [Corallibacter sp.]|uniref:hypothetical protein n=1 Tax=Corallibacter sp. TaxID=2038084 RepID=UPI003AB3B77C
MKPLKLVMITALALGFCTDLFACDCPEYQISEIDSISFDKNEIVLIGKIIIIQEDLYEIEIKEVLKGKVENKKIIGVFSLRQGFRSSCSFYPKYKTDFLLYLTPVLFDNQIYYYASQCSGSRSLDQKQKPVASYESDKHLKDWTEEWLEQMKNK